MNIRTTLILFGVLIASLVTFLIMQREGVETPGEREARDRRLLPSLTELIEKGEGRTSFPAVKTTDFTQVVIERDRHDPAKTERLEFRRVVGSAWRMVAPRDVRTDSFKVDDLIAQLVRAEMESTGGDINLGEDLAKYNLDNPPTLVTLTRDGKPYRVALGRQDTFRAPIVYATSPDRANKPIMLRRSQVEQVFTPLDEFRAHELLPGVRNVTAVRVKPHDGPEVAVHKGAGTAWKFADPKLGEADRVAAEQLANTLTNLRDQSFVAPAAQESHSLAEGKARLVATVEHKPDDKGPARTDRVLIGVRDAAPPIEASAVEAAAALAPLQTLLASGLAHANALADPDQGFYFAKADREKYVVRVEARHVRNLMKQPDDLRSKHLLPDAVGDHIPTIDVVHLKAGGELLRLYRPDLQAGGRPTAADWVLYTDKAGKQKTHLNTVPELLSNLKDLTVQAFLDDEPRMKAFGVQTSELGFDQPQAELTIWQSAIERDPQGKPEGKDEPKLKADAKEKPAVRFTFGRSGTSWWRPRVVYVRKQAGDGPALVVAVPDPFTTPRQRKIQIVEQATGGYLAFRDRTLPSFTYKVQGPNTQTSATKLAYQHRHGVPYQLVKVERRDDENPWRLVQPVEEKAGNNVNLILLSTLATKLSAARLITDAATDQDRTDKKYGFDKPLLQVTVTAQEAGKKPEEFTYTVGNHTGAQPPFADHYYARLEVKPGEGDAPASNRFIFLVPENILKSIDLELRDGFVFPDEKGLKPTEATFTWRKLDKDKKLLETKMHLVLKAETTGMDPAWKVQSLVINGKDATAEAPKLDDMKLKRFLGPWTNERFTELNHLATARYLVHKGKPEPRHRLDPASKDHPPALVIEVKYEQSAPRTLILGERWEQPPEEYPGLVDKAYYFATASTKLDTVFIMPDILFETMIAGFEHFKAVSP